MYQKFSEAKNLMSDIYLFVYAGSSPVPLTPDYGGPLVHYADGAFDAHFNRYLTVMEGIQTCKIKFVLLLVIRYNFDMISYF